MSVQQVMTDEIEMGTQVLLSDGDWATVQESQFIAYDDHPLVVVLRMLYPNGNLYEGYFTPGMPLLVFTQESAI